MLKLQHQSELATYDYMSTYLQFYSFLCFWGTFIWIYTYTFFAREGRKILFCQAKSTGQNDLIFMAFSIPFQRKHLSLNFLKEQKINCTKRTTIYITKNRKIFLIYEPSNKKILIFYIFFLLCLTVTDKLLLIHSSIFFQKKYLSTSDFEDA